LLRNFFTVSPWAAFRPARLACGYRPTRRWGCLSRYILKASRPPGPLVEELPSCSDGRRGDRQKPFRYSRSQRLALPVLRPARRASPPGPRPRQARRPGHPAGPAAWPPSRSGGRVAQYAPAMELSGTAAIISGGASGLGEAAARELAMAGSAVVIADL